MRLFLIGLVFFVILEVRAATYNASSASLVDVSNAVALTVSGDTVIVPTGTAIWTSTLSIDKSIQIIGAGQGQTIISNNIAGGNGVLLQFTAVPGYLVRVSGFTFVPIVTNTTYSSACAVVFLGDCPSIRVDHCDFLNLNQQAILFGSATFGVVDHFNLINNNNTSVGYGILAYGGNAGGNTGGNVFGHGDYAWSTNNPVQWGSTNQWVYLEDGVISFRSDTSSGVAVNDTDYGGKMVIRHCLMTNVFIQTHPTVGRQRGGRALEVYMNTNTLTGAYSNLAAMLQITGGSGVMWSNTLIGFAGQAFFVNRRATLGQRPWSGANGQNPWDANTNGLIASGTHTGTNNSYFLEDNTKTWTPGQFLFTYEVLNTSIGGTNTSQFSLIITNTATRVYTALSVDGAGSTVYWTNGQTYSIYQTYRILDQPGAGGGDLIVDTSIGSELPSNSVLHSLTFPRQPIDPFYSWGNTTNGIPSGFTPNWSFHDNQVAGGFVFSQGNDSDVQLGIDYLNTTKPSYTPLVYPHPLVQTNAPAPPVTGNVTTVGRIYF